MTANFPPPLALTLRLGTLIDSLPRADPRALERVRAIAERVTTERWDDLDARVQVWRQLHWLPLYLHFGKSRCWNSARVHAMPPEHLQALLESDLGVGAERTSLARGSAARGESADIASNIAIFERESLQALLVRESEQVI